MASAKGIAYALIVLLGILILATVLQLVQAAHTLRRERNGQQTAPRSSLALLATAIVALMLSYIFDVSVTALRLLQGSQTPPPSGAHLALVVITMFLGQGVAPAAIFASGDVIYRSRLALSGLEGKDASSVKRTKFSRARGLFLLVALPILTASYLGVFSKAVLDTPILASRYYTWLHTANGIYRAAIIVHALLFRELASHAISFHLNSKAHSIRDPIMRTSILYHLTPAMFTRTVALFVFAPLSSSFSTAKTPESATAILLGYDFFVGISTALAVQSLLRAAMRPASEWTPAKLPGQQEIENGDLPEDNPPPTVPNAPRRKHSRADSIVLSPTRSSFPSGSNPFEEPTKPSAAAVKPTP